MNVYKMMYKSLNKTRPIKYSYEMNQMIDIMKDNLDTDQNKLFMEFLDMMNKEQNIVNYKWFDRGINNAKSFILR